MHLAFDPGLRPFGLEPWLGELGELPDSLFDQTLYACCELADRYATDLALEIVRALELEPDLERDATVGEMLERHAFQLHFRPALVALLDRLAWHGEIERSGEPARYASLRPLRGSDRATLRELGLALDPKMAVALDLLEAAASVYGEVARGEAGGEQLLLAPGRIPLWLGYFANDNPVYALSNRIAARVAANRLPPGGGLRILEVGAGAGSATTALLVELEHRGRLGDLALYDATEPSVFFRRRGERELRARFPSVPFVFRGLDLDLPFSEQEGAGGYDLVFGVNVVHVARDLGASLAALRNALVPGGWLIAGECLRLFPGQPVAADLVFQLFRGFTGVQVDAVRPNHGFLEPRHWRGALVAAGFTEETIVPDVEGLRDRYPRFFAGALCGRRPSVESP
jgi:SAM-dependent methyltransferase